MTKTSFAIEYKMRDATVDIESVASRDVCLSVCLSVRLSQAGTVPNKITQTTLHNSQFSSFSATNARYETTYSETPESRTKDAHNT